MQKLGKYKANDKMSDLVCDDYSILVVISRFGIALGFGDRTVAEVCRHYGVDTPTFLAVINMMLDGERPAPEDCGTISIPCFLQYLHRSHEYFLDFRLPSIRRKLLEALGEGRRDLFESIRSFFDGYAAEVRKHMQYEEQTVFPYVCELLEGRGSNTYEIDMFHRQHSQIEAKITELKNILIKYYPGDQNYELNSALFDIFLCESDLASHNYVENNLFIPVVAALEAKVREKR